MPVRDWIPWLRGSRPTTTDLMMVGHRTGTGQVTVSSTRGVSNQEFGVSGTENFGGYIRKEDFNPELDNYQKAVAIYDKMRRTDAQIRAMLQVIKLPLRGATWTCQPASSDPVDKQIADFCNFALFDDDAMSDPWDFTLRHILLQMEFGVSVLEKIWMVDEENHYRFKRLAPRLPKTLREWHTDREGKLVALVQYAPVPQSTRRAPTGQQRVPTYQTSVSYQYLTIPAEYLAVFSLEREGDNYQGYSLLRNVYRNWWFKDQAYHTMGVGLDRWGVGIPVAELENGHGLTTGDLETLREVLQAIRANERAYLVAPAGVRFRILPEAQGKGTMGTFGIAWLDHNDSQISRNVLAGFLTMGRDPRGTLGFGSRLTDMFISSLNGVAKGICGDLRKQVIEPLCELNFDMTMREYPEPVCLDLEQVDLEKLIEVLAKLTGTVFTAQDEDEDIMRKMLGLPKLDKSNSRKEAAKKAPAQQGVPGVAGTGDGQAPVPGQQPPGQPDPLMEAMAAAAAAEEMAAAGATEEEDADDDDDEDDL